MSHYLGVWKSTKGLTAKEAATVYAAIASGVKATSKLPITGTSAVGAMYRELTRKWPELDRVKAKDRDRCPWSDRIAWCDRHMHLPMVFSWAEDASAEVEKLAAKHGLDVYDPQERKLLRPAAARASLGTAEPRLSPGDAAKRLVLAISPRLEKLGFVPEKKRAGELFAARRGTDLVQRIAFGRANSRSVGMVVSVDHATLSPLLGRVRGTSAVPIFSILLYACWFARFYAIHEGDRGNEVRDTDSKDADRDFMFQYDVCHASSVARAADDIDRMVRAWVVPFFGRLDTIAKIEAWWNAPGWKKFKGSLQKGDIRWQVGTAPPEFLGVALAAVVGRKDFEKRLAKLESETKASKAAPHPFTAPQAKKFFKDLRAAARAGTLAC